MLKSIRNNGLVLALFACVSTGVVAVTYMLTKDTIKAQQTAQLQGQLNQVIPTTLHDNELYKDCILLNSQELGSNDDMPAYIATVSETPTAIALEAIAPDGYNGTIRLLIGIDLEGTVQGVRVLSHQETPGLGDKIDLRITDWILSFGNKRIEDSNQSLWRVRKDGGQFDQFTGATITPRAVVNAVYRAGRYFNQNQASILGNAKQCEEE